MIKYENDCVGCPHEMGCLGQSCPERNAPHLYCDFCGEETDELRDCDGDEICEDCLLGKFPSVKIVR